MLSFLAELKGPIVNGLLLGGLYGIIGLGMSMIFGIVRMVNLAHGDLVILGQLSEPGHHGLFSHQSINHIDPGHTGDVPHWIRHPVLPS